MANDAADMDALMDSGIMESFRVKMCIRDRVETLWDTVKRFENPHNYYVDLSQKLWDIKQELLRAGSL